MVERNYDEDDHSFRERLDSLTDKFREKRQAWSASTRQTGAAGRQKARQAVSRTQDFYSANPLVVGILAAAAGAAMGSALPVSRQEREKLGSLGEKAREMASEQTEQLTPRCARRRTSYWTRPTERSSLLRRPSRNSKDNNPRPMPTAPEVVETKRPDASRHSLAANRADAVSHATP